MSDEVAELLARNKAWAARVKEEDAGFFERLASGQKPQFLWIGCSDSRVPANQITGLLPGEVFVHRNVANVVMQTDLNCMSVIEFAIRVVKVRHVIVCGHYGCAGVKAAMENSAEGIIDHWLSGLRVLWSEYKDELEGDPEAFSKFCELSVRQQVRSLGRTSVIQDTWARGQDLDIHGWIYGLEDGIIRDLGYRVASPEDAKLLA